MSRPVYARVLAPGLALALALARDAARAAALAAALLALSAAGAAGAAGPGLPVVGVLTRAPEVLVPSDPVYPEAAREAGAGGEVVLEIEVSATGEVTDAVVTAPAGHGLDEAALAAARGLRFSPAEVDGAPAAVRLEYRYRFEPPPPAPAPASDLPAEAPPAPAPPAEDDVPELGLTIRGERDRAPSRVAISAAEIAKVPGVSGDAVRVLQNLPGVARAPGGLGLLVVRGGNPRDTRVSIDGVEVPLAFHFGGVTSVYASDLLAEVEFEPGNAGVRSGRAIGGRVNLVTRDPSAEPHGLVDANLYHATALVEGPAGPPGVTFALAARRSYVDAVIGAASASLDDAPGFSVAPRYYDLQAKLAYAPEGGADRLTLDLYGSDDRMVLTGVETGGLRDLDVVEYGVAFYQATLGWQRRLGDATRATVQLGGGVYLGNERVSDVFSLRERAFTGKVRAELTHELGDRLTLAVGGDGVAHPNARVRVTAPPIPPPGQVPSPGAEPRRFDQVITGLEGGAFVEATWRPADALTLVPGVRIDGQRALVSRAWVDPRLSGRLQLGADTALEAAAGLYHQPPPTVYTTEEWGNPAVVEEGAWQLTAGAERRLPGGVSLDVQLYYKRLFDLALPSDRTVERDGRLVPERFASEGTGKAYGAELLLRLEPGGRFSGWLAYSLSRAIRDQSVAGGRLEDEGDAYDQPHNVVAVGTVELPELWAGLSAGARLRYTSGGPYERIRGAVYDADADAYEPLRTAVAGDRLPDFFQLDVRVDKTWRRPGWSLSAYLEVQNVTNRRNAEGVAYSHDYGEQDVVSGLPFFPAFGLRAEL